MPKNNFLITITICTALLTNSIFAGIYQVAVLQSPDGSQLVRIYFDNHALGTIEQNEQQFEIIANSIKQFSATNKHLEILVEAPRFYLPLEQDWVYVLDEEEQPQDIQAITYKTLQAETSKQSVPKLQELPKYQSSLFLSIPYLIGQQIKPTNPEYKNIRIISIDPRDSLIKLRTFSQNDTVPQSFQNLSLNDIFTQMLAQTLITHKTIDYMHASSPQREAAAITHQTAIREKLAQSTSQETKKYREKIDKQYAMLNTEFTNFIHAFKAELGAEAWNREFTPNTPFETLFDPGQQAIIKNHLAKAVLYIKSLEYNLLQYVIEPESAQEIAIFVGGNHANNIAILLSQLGYTPAYQNGYTADFITKNFEIIPFNQGSIYKQIIFYPPEAITRINTALSDTLSAHMMPLDYTINTPITISFVPTELSDAIIKSESTKVKHFFMRARTNPLDVNKYMLSQDSSHIFTPLQIAIQNAHNKDQRTDAIKTIKMLLKFGANPHLNNDLNQNAFDLAAHDAQITELLQKLNINTLDFHYAVIFYIKEIKPQLEQALSMLHKNENPKVPLEDSLIRLSEINYLAQKSTFDNDTKTILRNYLSEFTALCETIKATPQYNTQKQIKKSTINVFLQKINIMMPGLQPNIEKPIHKQPSQ